MVMTHTAALAALSLTVLSSFGGALKADEKPRFYPLLGLMTPAQLDELQRQVKKKAHPSETNNEKPRFYPLLGPMTPAEMEKLQQEMRKRIRPEEPIKRSSSNSK